MAQFNVTGFDEIEKQLLKQSEKASKAVPLMLEAGADILVETQQKEAEQLFGVSARSKGDLKRSIKKDKVKTNSTSSFVEVYPHGKDSKGERNARKGFVLNYGRSNMPAQPWMDTANAKSEDKVHARMRGIWEGTSDGD